MRNRELSFKRAYIDKFGDINKKGEVHITRYRRFSTINLFKYYKLNINLPTHVYVLFYNIATKNELCKQHLKLVVK